MSTHEQVAERQLIALALTGNPALERRFAAIPPDAWTPGIHETVATVLRDRITREIPIDAVMISAAASDVVGTDDRAQRVHAFVVSCATSAPTGESWDYYEELVLRHLHLRRLHAAGLRIAQLSDAGLDGGEVSEIAGLIQASVEDLTAGVSVAGPPMSLQDLLDQEEEPYDWLIPDLIERMDRLIITGFEGSGKSFLLAQMAVTVAAGLHPFSGYLIEPNGFRVLVVDCENSRKQVQRRYRGIRERVNLLREQAGASPIDWSKQVRLDIRPAGLDLTDAMEFARLEQAIAATAPDLVMAGPIYRMHRQNINDEQAARELVDALDRLRTKYRFALILEAHCGHIGETSGGRKLRPTGSSLFMRWPEFGMGIRGFGDAASEEHPSTVEMVTWRGSRDERRWPSLLKHSSSELPWTPAEWRYREDHGMPRLNEDRTQFEEQRWPA